jgi:glucose/mannose-6-phosphate isomerase
MEMNELIAGFSKQMQEAIAIGESATLTASAQPIRNVIVTGLGGSGIGGTIVAQITEKELSVPMIVNKDYFLPAWVNTHTLVIVSSYSGNTEETLQALQSAIEKKAKIVCITSGGKIAEIAAQNNFDCIHIPGGMPPRSCFGYSSIQLFYVLGFHKLISENFHKDLRASVALLDKYEDEIMQDAAKLAHKLNGKLPVIYCEARYEGVAIRFRQQINENSKMLCWHHVLPEMNHNELVGWTEQHDEIYVIQIRNADDYFRTQRRMEISREVISNFTPHYHEMHSRGETQLQRSYYLVHLGDWVSWYIAEQKKIDATEVRVIDRLKNELSKI